MAMGRIPWNVAISVMATSPCTGKSVTKRVRLRHTGWDSPLRQTPVNSWDTHTRRVTVNTLPKKCLKSKQRYPAMVPWPRAPLGF